MAMYDHGKSDSFIVPEKLPNKSRGAPRSVEGGELAKGNLVQQDSLSTQRWDDLQHVLDPVRQAVKA